jgi:hypothetical protein
MIFSWVAVNPFCEYLFVVEKPVIAQGLDAVRSAQCAPYEGFVQGWKVYSLPFYRFSFAQQNLSSQE